MANFVSDNVAGVHPVILQALAQANSDFQLPYGADSYSKQLEHAFAEVFECDLTVIPCLTGTAANALALSQFTAGHNAVWVHANSHLYVDECNAPEMFSGGCRLTPVAGEQAKIDINQLAPLAATIGASHSPQPSGISLTQTTEEGTVYSLDEIRALSSFAKRHKLITHMDGARFANALVSLNCSPADMTWRAGVDIVSFGASKNGCMAAEAIIIFDSDLAKDSQFRLKRSGQLVSKQRFLACQLLSYLQDELWLKSAEHANSMMHSLYAGLSRIHGIDLPSRCESNMIFVRFAEQHIQKLQAANLAGYLYPDGRMRLVCSWQTEASHVEAFINALRS